jgi:hypothetical protein
MRKSVHRIQPVKSGEIQSVELCQVSGAATLSVGNLLLSVPVTTSTTSNIDTALQLPPR